MPSMADFTDPAWLKARLQPLQTIASVDLESMSGAGGQSGDMQRIVMNFEDKSKSTYVLKRTKENGESQSITLGLAREGIFYNHHSEVFPSDSNFVAYLPQVFFSEGDLEEGTKTILMEDLSTAVQSGHLFGAGSPLNWGKDLTALTSGKGFNVEKLTVARITQLAFSAAATLHASCWQHAGLNDVHWLRASSWNRGEGRDSWVASQAHIAGMWTAVKAKIANAEDGSHFLACGESQDGVAWDPLVVDCLDASIARASEEAHGWETFQSEIRTRPFTLVQGDFHPANMMLCLPEAGRGEDEPRLVLVDWEVVGVGSGPQELGQYMISHTRPEVRAALERGALEAYYKELVQRNTAVAASLTWDACWEEYVAGGVGRWMWLLPLLARICPAKMAQYFHDQVKAFCQTHLITADNVPLPRA
ncbi:hypothetical protein CYMTET_29506 [Cymbomonas tetramitiformis]|uniref:Aminoglycoside phosphotransferase domain-containing protein n=1 Tax=Cymbomonas tetramitiformis TaxID=36881 RepID=A0AAE0FMC2_9CHLO|nr:hypothetical protein CYMTET_29506 [Cymbomonas tetramitiformis]|eukprot:gene18277-21787_t